jgi:hypothetical protein
VSRRDPQRARVLGLWTAGWLAVFLVVGMVWLGEPSVQWPVLAVPLLWAMLALRPRRGGAAVDDDRYDEDSDHGDDDGWDDDGWDDEGAAPWDAQPAPRPAERTDTVERPALRRSSGYDEWGGRRRS